MGYLSKRRGVISIFLLIIYVITYVFMGALVDAGRYRIAQTYAEAALDNASTSVLANYNKLVYDLYGLFSVDLGATSEEELQSKIKSSYEKYLNESLGLASVNKDEYTTKLNKLLEGVMDSFSKESQPADADSKKTFPIGTDALYNFQITELNVGTNITLADTANVENQIIEHMKYRAPVELVQNMSGFLNGLKELVGMGKQITAVTEKMKITSKPEYTSLPQTAASLPAEVDEYAKKVKEFGKKYDLSLLECLAAYFDLFVGYETLDGYFAYVEGSTSYKNVYFSACAAADVYCSSSNRTKLNNAIYNEFKEPIPEDATEEEIEKIEEKNEKLKNEIVAYTINEIMDLAYEIREENSTVNSIITSIETERNEKRTTAANEYRASVRFLPETTEVESSYKLYWKMEKAALDLYQEGKTLLEKIESVVSKYENYISELESLEKKNEDDSITSGICDADVQIAKSSAGSMLKYINYLNKTIDALNKVYDGNTLSNAIKEAERHVADEEVNDFLNGGSAGIWEKKTLYWEVNRNNYNGIHDKISKASELTEFLAGESDEITKDYDEESKTDDGESKKQKAEKIADTEPKTSEKKPNEEVEKDGKKIDTTLIIENPGLLDVKFQSTSSNLEGVKNMDTSLDVDDEKMDAAWVTKLLEMGTTIVQGISNMLNDARDNLYINCYIMDMFPNYYVHYSKAEDNKDDKLLSEERSKYNASLAEVEFIITGAGLSEEEFYKSLAEEEEKGAFAKFFDWLFDKEEEKKEIDGIGELSVKEFRSKLFGTRMLFNTISMFLDTSKYTQATTISAWAGPLAPVVAIVLMVAWAVAETVIDTMVLMGETVEDISVEKNTRGMAVVPLLKLSAEQWFLSLENVVENLVNTAIGAAAEGIVNAADTLKTSMLNKADEAMFDMYEKAKDAVDKKIEFTATQCQQVTANTLGTWLEQMTSGVAEIDGVDPAAKKYADDIADGVNDAISEGINTAEEKAKKMADKGIEATYNGVKGEVMETLTTIGDKVTDSIESTVNNAAESAKKFVQEKIDKVLPEMVGTGKGKGCDFKMGYTDYLMFFLLTMDGDVKIKRVMALIQVNITNGMNKEYKSGEEIKEKFLLENCPVSVWADMELSMKYMFMSEKLVPQSIRKDSRMRLKVISAQSY